MAIDPLDDFHRTHFTHLGVTKDVFVAGAGPAVIVMAEMPGITPSVARFARVVMDRGYTVWMPQLFGQPGVEPGAASYVRAIGPACVSKEFAAFSRNSTAPISQWLRALARYAHAECGGPGVGALGMCWTGGFALGMMVDPVVVAPVLSQPSLPLNLTKRHKAALHLSPQDLAAVKARAADGQCVMGLRFTGDPLCPPDRFATLRAELGDAFIGVEIDSSKENAWGIRRLAHSVVTEDLVTDDPEHPTARALAQVLDFFDERLME